MFVDKQRCFLFKDHFLYSCSIKFDLNDTIFAYDYRARLACIMTLRQIVDVISENCARVDGQKS